MSRTFAGKLNDMADLQQLVQARCNTIAAMRDDSGCHDTSGMDGIRVQLTELGQSFQEQVASVDQVLNESATITPEVQTLLHGAGASQLANTFLQR